MALDASAQARLGVDANAHHALAREVARDWAVLLKNDGALLPLQPSPGETLAVIGEFARTPRYQGAGSSQVNPTRVDVPLDELRTGVPAGVDVRFEPGFDLEDTSRNESLASTSWTARSRTSRTSRPRPKSRGHLLALIFPVLNGLDEMDPTPDGEDPDQVPRPRAQALLRALNTAPRTPLVLVSRDVSGLSWHDLTSGRSVPF